MARKITTLKQIKKVANEITAMKQIGNFREKMSKKNINLSKLIVASRSDLK